MIVTSFEIRGQDEGAVVRRFDDIRKAAADARREMEGAAEAFRRRGDSISRTRHKTAAFSGGLMRVGCR